MNHNLEVTREAQELRLLVEVLGTERAQKASGSTLRLRDLVTSTQGARRPRERTQR